MDAHVASTAVQDLFTLLSSISVTPIVSILDLHPGLHITKTGALTNAPEPWILLQEITYKNSSTIPLLLPSWANVVSAAKQEEGTLQFGVYTNPKDATKLVTVEVYKSFEYFVGTHAPGDALAGKNRQTGDAVAVIKGAELKKVGGFWGKE